MHSATHLTRQGGKDVASGDVEESRGNLGAHLQDLVEVQ